MIHGKNKIMRSGPITSWQIVMKTMETVTDFILGGSKMTADGDCSYEIKRCLLLGRKAMTSLDSMWESGDNTLQTKVHSQRHSFFSSQVRMWKLDRKEGWVLKNCFWTVVLEKTLESPLDCKEIKPVSLKGNQSWILKLQYFGHLMWRTDSLEKTLMLGKNPLQCSCLENPRDGGAY